MHFSQNHFKAFETPSNHTSVFVFSPSEIIYLVSYFVKFDWVESTFVEILLVEN